MRTSWILVLLLGVLPGGRARLGVCTMGHLMWRSGDMLSVATC